MGQREVTPYMRLKKLHEELIYYQMLNRMAQDDYNAGLKKIKSIMDEMNLIQKLEEERKAKKRGNKKTR